MEAVPVGAFITFEGVEGSGKSTQALLLANRFENDGRGALSLREPGATALGEEIRRILLGSAGAGMTPLAELFLYEAARAELSGSILKEALDSGKIVLCDRFTDSTVAYQGFGRGMDISVIESLNAIASRGKKPDLTLLFDIAPEEGLKRAWARINGKSGAGAPAEDRFEKEAIEFHRRVREGFLYTAKRDSARVRVIDASASVGEIHEKVCHIVDEFLAR